MNVAGIDVGLTLIDRTSGVCRTGDDGEVIAHTYIDRLSRVQELGRAIFFDVLAIDAPVLLKHELHYRPRACEKMFIWGAFQRRCKCGETQVSGTGQALRRAGIDTAHAFADDVATSDCVRAFPRVFGDHNIVEAFPNAFIGITLPEQTFGSTLARGAKFDWLYDRWLESGVPGRLKGLLGWDRETFWRAIEDNSHHDERAALVCALTALCVLRGTYVAVGEPSGGYFFLPPWETWAEWARTAVNQNRIDRRLPAPVEIWISGNRFTTERALQT
jgi:predicted nuclease with RNAse H fold